MASFINTNMASLNTQRSLSASQAALNTSIQRLSSGMRVNSAKDDAAGMAIASRMDSLIKGQTVAMRNANDAISYSQTAEGALGKIGDNLQRMRELAVQAANGTNGSADRVSLNTEFTQLQAEVKRITSNTNFNGISVLDGTSQTFQIGAGTNASDVIKIESSNLTGKVAGGTTAYASDVSWVATTTDTMSTIATTAVAAAADSSSTDARDDSQKGIKAGEAIPAAAGVNILDQGNASRAIDDIDKALKQVNTESIKHGANQNRFAAVISTLQVSTENQTAARSRIMDTDFASETATMARGQILQQAGMAMLAQANQLPNGVMSLLK